MLFFATLDVSKQNILLCGRRSKSDLDFLSRNPTVTLVSSRLHALTCILYVIYICDTVSSETDEAVH